MLRNNGCSYTIVFILLALIFCPLVRGAEQVAKEAAVDQSTPAEPATADVWASIENTIQALADPFAPKIVTDEIIAPVVAPVVEPPPTPQPVIVEPVRVSSGPAITDALVQTQIPLPSLEVSGIIYNSDMPMAIINGHVYAIGEKFLTGEQGDETATLKAVNAGSVEVNFMGKNHKIPLEGI